MFNYTCTRASSNITIFYKKDEMMDENLFKKYLEENEAIYPHKNNFFFIQKDFSLSQTNPLKL